MGSAVLLILITLPLPAAEMSDLLVMGGRHLTEGRAADALIELEQALKEYRRKRNAEGEAATLLLIAIAERNRSNDGAARSHLQNARRIMLERNDAIGTWLILSSLAQLERSLGNYGTALIRQDEARMVIEKAEAADVPVTFAVFDLIASALGLPGFDSSHGPSGAADFLQAIVLEAMVKPLTHYGYADILIEVGQYDRAEKELNAVLTGSPLFPTGYESSVAARFGELRYRQHRFAEARAHYKEALQGSLRMPLNPINEYWIRIGIDSRLAELEMAENHLDEALAWNDQSLAILRRARLPLEVNILEERGLLLLQGDRLKEAETVLEQALEIAIANDDIAQQASLETHLADSGFLLGRYGAAVAHLEAAIRIRQMLQQQTQEGLLWANLAVCYILMSKDDTAERLLADARELAGSSQADLVCDLTMFLQTVQVFRKVPDAKDGLRAALRQLTANPIFESIDPRGDARRALRESLSLVEATTPAAGPANPATLSSYAGLAYSNLGWRQLDSGNTTAARQFFEKALNANSAGELRARYQAAVGVCHWRAGDVGQAIQWFTGAAETLDTVVGDLRAESMLVGFLGSEDHRAYYDVLIEALLRAHHDEKAFEVTERARARGLLRTGNEWKAASAVPSGSLAATADRVRQKIERGDTSEAAGETVEDLHLRYELLRSRIQSTLPESLAGDGVAPLALADIWRELPHDTTLISYFVSPMGAHAWVLDREGIEHVTLKLDAGQLKRVGCWSTQFFHEKNPQVGQRGGRVPGDCGSDAASSAEVYATLFAPLRGKIRNSRIMIVPHGVLHSVPFAALYDPRTKHFLIEDYTLIQLPSASALRLLRSRESPVLGASLVLGDPDAAGPTALPGANLEVQRVAKMLGTKPKTGRDASEELLYHLDGKVDLLHIAAHGTYDLVDPFFSAIMLAASDKRNGQLTVDEILSGVELSGVNLVVLSACQSGLGKRSGGDDVVGLTRALLYAGSPGVISTLWSINDKATTSLMERFYSRLLAGSTAADALRTAQLGMLRDARFRDPYYWAAFQLTGDPAGRWKTPSH